MSIESRLKKLEETTALKDKDNRVTIVIGGFDDEKDEEVYVSSPLFEEEYKIMTYKEFKEWETQQSFDEVIRVTASDDDI